MTHIYQIDHDRENRLGFSEVIFGESKSLKVLEEIISNYQKKNKNALITKLQSRKALKLVEIFQPAFFDEISNILLIGEFPQNVDDGNIAILSGGTSDQYLVNEIYYTLLFLGHNAQRFQDIGVAGLHRLISRLDEIR